MCVPNSNASNPNPCRNHCDRHSVLVIQAGRSRNETFIVECVACHNSSPILSRAEAIIRWNSENPNVPS